MLENLSDLKWKYRILIISDVQNEIYLKEKIKFLPSRKGERYASALTNMSLSNKVQKNFGKISLRKYVENFLKNNKF